jgi:hypothetical protein
MNKNYILSTLISMVSLLVGRNECGNKVLICFGIPLYEDDLRKIEKAVLTNLNQIVTVFWKKSNSSDPHECEITLDFDAKLPYDRYPLQGLLEGGLKK